MEPFLFIMTAQANLKKWHKDDKPREKMLEKGKEVLTNSELLAILIGSGTKGENVVELSRRILNESGNKLGHLARLDVKSIARYKGIGEVKAIKILAALELGRRLQGEEEKKVVKIKSSRDAFLALTRFLSDKKREEFWVIYLNNSSRVLKMKCIAQGGITQTTADIRLIFRDALEYMATAVILAHNHPSGNLEPSESDIKLTRKIKEAGQLLSINVLDHLIVAENNYFSFTDEGIL